jgi:hypothetical protein
MKTELEFQKGIPEVKKGDMAYVFIASKSPHNGKVYCYGAHYLNEYPLNYEYGCSRCDSNPDKCVALDGDGCPTTGWFTETNEFDADIPYYQSVTGEVLAWAKVPSIEAKLFENI